MSDDIGGREQYTGRVNAQLDGSTPPEDEGETYGSDVEGLRRAARDHKRKREEEAAANPPVTVAIGDTATIEGEQSGPVTVEVTVATPEQHTADPDGFEPANGVWLVVDVTVAVIAGNYTFSDIYFSFEAADGTAYYASFTAFAPALESDTISAGDEINGKLAFDVPPSVIDGGKFLIEGVSFDFSELPGAIWTL